MKKRLLVLFTVTFALISLLAACGTKDDNSKGGKDSGKGEKPYEILWYTIGTPQPDTDKVFEEVNKYTLEKINATVKMTQIDWGDYDEKMSVIISSGEPFDLSFTHGGEYVQNALKGGFYPLDELLDSHGKDLKEVLDPAFIEGAKIDGKLYGIPSNKEVGGQTVYTFNKRLVEKYDFDIESIKSLEDLEPMLQTIKENESGVTPIATFEPFLPVDWVMDTDLPFVFPLEGDSDKVVNVMETDVAMETYKTMHKYYKAGYIEADAATSNETWPMDVENWFVRLGGYQPYADLLWSRSAKYDVISQPAHETPITFNNTVTGAIQAISATSKNPEKVMEFLNLLNTDPYLRNLVDKGIEGVHYEQNDDGTIKDLEARIERYNMPSYSLGNHFILHLYEDDPADKWDAFEEFNAASEDAPSLGFHFDSTKVRTEIASISNVANEFFPIIRTGTVDPEEYIPLANEKFKEAGMDKVLEEIQKQFDEWKAEN